MNNPSNHLKNTSVMKRFVNLLLSFVLGISIMMTGYTSYADELLLVDYDFEAITSMPSGWSRGALAEAPRYAGQSIKFNAYGTYTLPKSVSGGSVIVSYDLLRENLSTSERLIQIWDTSNHRVAYIEGSSTGMLTLMGTEAGSLARYSVNEWFNITLAISLEDKTFDIYYNGIPIKTNCGFFESDAMGAIGSINTTGSANSTVYVDNVYIRHFVGKDEAKAAANSRFATNFRYYDGFDGLSGNVSTVKTNPNRFYARVAGAEYVAMEDGNIALAPKSPIVNPLRTPVAQGALLMSYDFYVKEKKEIRLIQAWDADGIRPLLIQLFPSGIITVQASGGSGTPIGEYKLNDWNTVTAIMDFSQEKVHVYLNGAYCGSFNYFDRAATGISFIDTSAAADFYLDNISVEQFGSLDMAQTYISVTNEKDEIVKSKVCNYSETVRKFTADSNMISGAAAEAKEILAYFNNTDEFNSTYDMLWSEDFDAYADDTSYQRSKVSAFGAKVNKKHLYMAAANKPDGAGYTRLFLTEDTPGKFYVEFEFMQSRKSKVETIARFTDNSGYSALSIASDNGNIYFYDYDDTIQGKRNILVENYKENRWYNIKIYVDKTLEIYRIYLDGSQIGDSYGFINKGKGVNRIFDTYLNVSDSQTDNRVYYLDNMKVYKTIDKVNYEVNSITFEDADGNTVYMPSNGGVLKSIEMKCNSELPAHLLVAVYENDMLEKCEIIKNITSGIHELDIRLSPTADNAKVRFFVWSADENMVPLNDVIEVQKDFRKLFILSDSIFAELPEAVVEKQGSTGVGKVLPDYFDSSHLQIVNKAYCGESTKSFIDSGKLRAALSEMSSGDYALISFSHNDQKKGSSKYTPVEEDLQAPYAEGTYQRNLVRYVELIQAKGAIPFFVTAIPRYSLTADGTANETHGNYVIAMKKVAEELNIPVIDVNKFGMEQLNLLKTEALKYYMASDPNYSTDKTHLNELGANWIASYIVEEATRLKLPFADYRITQNN